MHRVLSGILYASYFMQSKYTASPLRGMLSTLTMRTIRWFIRAFQRNYTCRTPEHCQGNRINFYLRAQCSGLSSTTSRCVCSQIAVQRPLAGSVELSNYIIAHRYQMPSALAKRAIRWFIRVFQTVAEHRQDNRINSNLGTQCSGLGSTTSRA